MRVGGVVAVVVLALGAVAAREAYLALTARVGPVRIRGADLVALTERFQGCGRGVPDAWPVFADAASRMEAMLESVRAEVGAAGSTRGDLSLLTGVDWDSWPLEGDPEAHRAVAHEIVRRFAASGIPSLLDELAASRCAVRPAQAGRLARWILPEATFSRVMTRALVAEMHAAHLSQRGVDAQALERALAIVRVCAAQTSLVEQVTALDLVRLVLREVRHELLAGGVPPDRLRGIHDAFARQLPLPPMEPAIEGTRLRALEFIEHTHTDNGRGDGRVVLAAFVREVEGEASGLPDPSLANMRSLFMAGRAETTRMLHEVMDAFVARSKMSRHEYLRSRAGRDVLRQIQEHQRYYAVLNWALPAMGLPFTRRAHAELDLAGTQVMLAIERFRAERGVYPERLDELVPDYLPAIPADTFSPLGLRYRRIDAAADPLGRAYLLYSTGIDGEDNDGVEHEYRIRALFPSEEEGGRGFDYVLNVPRYEAEFRRPEERLTPHGDPIDPVDGVETGDDGAAEPGDAPSEPEHPDATDS